VDGSKSAEPPISAETFAAITTETERRIKARAAAIVAARDGNVPIVIEDSAASRRTSHRSSAAPVNVGIILRSDMAKRYYVDEDFETYFSKESTTSSGEKSRKLTNEELGKKLIDAIAENEIRAAAEDGSAEASQIAIKKMLIDAKTKTAGIRSSGSFAAINAIAIPFQPSPPEKPW